MSDRLVRRSCVLRDPRSEVTTALQIMSARTQKAVAAWVASLLLTCASRPSRQLRTEGWACEEYTAERISLDHDCERAREGERERKLTVDPRSEHTLQSMRAPALVTKLYITISTLVNMKGGCKATETSSHLCSMRVRNVSIASRMQGPTLPGTMSSPSFSNRFSRSTSWILQLNAQERSAQRAAFVTSGVPVLFSISAAMPGSAASQSLCCAGDAEKIS